jgi:hypothetical protein
MMVMPGNNSSAIVHYWAGAHPGKIGWLVGPTAVEKTTFRDWMPFALDNDAFSAYANGTPWDYHAWRRMLDHVADLEVTKPLWALVPDVVGQRDATINNWWTYHETVRQYGFIPAFALQDGMTHDNVPENATHLFLGGTTEWKWKTLPYWAELLDHHLHVGRVNSLERLWTCDRYGVNSVDGTGWFRDTMEFGKAADLRRWIEGKAPHPLDLFQ